MFHKIVVFLFLCFYASCVFAVSDPPVDGIYWDPSQSGRGYAVETQDNKIFVAIYNYDANSSPTFYTIQGDWDSSQHRIRNPELLQVTSGPWIGGPFSAVGQLVSKGPVVFDFPTPTTARFVFNGRTSNLQRILFGYGPQANSLMRGLWHTTYGASGLSFGDFLNISGPCTIAACASLPEAFVGTANGSSARILIGTRLPDGRIMVLVDSSTSYYSMYVFEVRVNLWVGFEATFLKTTTSYPTSGLAMTGNRMLGPSYMKSLGATEPSPAAVETMNSLRADASAAVPQTMMQKSKDTDDVVRALPALKMALERLQ